MHLTPLAWTILAILAVIVVGGLLINSNYTYQVSKQTSQTCKSLGSHNVHRGSVDYYPQLDRDNNGIACQS